MSKRTKKFYIYPNPENKYWKVEVNIKPSLNAVRRDFASRNDSECGNVLAFCRKWKRVYVFKGDTKVCTGEIAKIVFSSDKLDMDIIPHECGHAAFEYCSRRRKNKFRDNSDSPNVGSDEETFCYALGSMTQQVVTWAIKHGYEF